MFFITLSLFTSFLLPIIYFDIKEQRVPNVIIYPGLGVLFAYSMILRSVERVNLPMVVSIAALIINTILNYGLILGKLGMPELGIQGAAIGVLTVAETVAVVSVAVVGLGRKRRMVHADLSDEWGVTGWS